MSRDGPSCVFAGAVILLARNQPTTGMLCPSSRYLVSQSLGWAFQVSLVPCVYSNLVISSFVLHIQSSWDNIIITMALITKLIHKSMKVIMLSIGCLMLVNGVYITMPSNIGYVK